MAYVEKPQGASQADDTILEGLKHNLGFLEVLVQASGFTLRPAPPDVLAEMEKKGLAGWYTNMSSREIFFNPKTLARKGQRYGEGVLSHEAGHHHPFVRRFQDGMGQDLHAPPLLPKLYDNNNFLGHCHNGLADVLLEAVMGRYPYTLIRNRLDHTYESEKPDVARTVANTVSELSGENRAKVLANLMPKALAHFVPEEDKAQATADAQAYVEAALSDNPPKDPESALSPALKTALSKAEAVLKDWDGSHGGKEAEFREDVRLAVTGYLKRNPMPEQYIQLFLGENRYPTGFKLEEMVEPEVIEAYKRTLAAGSMKTLQDVEFFQKPFLPDQYQDKSYYEKLDAYRDVFRAEYIKLIGKEVEKRAKEGGGKGGKGGSGGGGGHGMPDSVPMTKEERDKLIEALKKQLKSGGKPQQGKGEPVNLSEADMREIAKALKDELDKLGEKYKSMCDRDEEAKRKLGEKVEGRGQGREPDFFDKLRDAARGMEQADKAGRARGLGEKYGIPSEVIEEYMSIRERRAELINRLADDLTDVFRDNRMAILSYNKREGEWTPGLEAETVGEMRHGNLEPETMMKTVENPEFAKTEIKFVFDLSGSMGGAPSKATREMLVVVMEALEVVRTRLQGEAMLRPDEEVPLKIGVSAFDVKHYPIHPLGKPVDEEAKIHVVHELHKVGGGTDDYKTTKAEWEDFKVGKKNVIKIFILLSDAYGDKDKMRGLSGEMAQDKTIISLMLGFGSDPETISTVWGEAAKGLGAETVFAEPFPENDVERATPFVADFLRRVIPPRVEKMTAEFRGY